jgi:hypothetical protein
MKWIELTQKRRNEMNEKNKAVETTEKAEVAKVIDGNAKATVIMVADAMTAEKLKANALTGEVTVTRKYPEKKREPVFIDLRNKQTIQITDPDDNTVVIATIEINRAVAGYNKDTKRADWSCVYLKVNKLIREKDASGVPTGEEAMKGVLQWQIKNSEKTNTMWCEDRSMDMKDEVKAVDRKF